tara:strand:+ start:279 stop:512 length:234 start_codon:yes stop_codon:yes gene_type:complete
MIKQIARVEGPYGLNDENEIIVFQRKNNKDYELKSFSSHNKANIWLKSNYKRATKKQINKHKRSLEGQDYDLYVKKN